MQWQIFVLIRAHHVFLLSNWLPSCNGVSVSEEAEVLVRKPVFVCIPLLVLVWVTTISFLFPVAFPDNVLGRLSPWDYGNYHVPQYLE